MDSNSDNVYILGGREGEQYLIQGDEIDIKKRKSILGLDDNDSTEQDRDEDISKLLIPKQIKIEASDVETLDTTGSEIPEGMEDSSCEMVSPEEFFLQHGAQLLYSDKNSVSVLKNEIDENGIIIEHMDIRYPLSTLRNLLQKRFNIDLSDYKFWLQDAQMLEPHKNLVDQCVQGEGLVQINVEIKREGDLKKINIVDVLKPTDEFLLEQEEKSGEEKDHDVQWVIDNNFNKELERLKIPQDPRLWNKQQVRLWLVWAVRQFNLSGLKLSDWMIDGNQLCKMTLDTFKKKVPKDPDDLFWTHLELLRKCKFVAIIQKQKPENKQNTDNSPSTSTGSRKINRPKEGRKISRVLGSTSVVSEHKSASGNRSAQKLPTSDLNISNTDYDSGYYRKRLSSVQITITAPSSYPLCYHLITCEDWQLCQLTLTSGSNNGQIQLWQFLLELLTDKYHRDVIQWITDDGEFKLNNPEMVAQLWGQRKNKPTMTYEKLSRALRYYYDGDMISKVHGKRFVYKFVCDLKQLLGYSASELNHLVTESALKSGIDRTYCDFYEHIL